MFPKDGWQDWYSSLTKPPWTPSGVREARGVVGVRASSLGLGTEREEVNPETPLVALCAEEYAEKGDFAKSLADCLKGMKVKHLGGYTEDKLMAFVKSEGGPNGLVPAWLKQHGLRSYLDGYVASMDAPSTIETTSRQLGALLLGSAPDVHGSVGPAVPAPRAFYVSALFLFSGALTPWCRVLQADFAALGWVRGSFHGGQCEHSGGAHGGSPPSRPS